jgi:hypothetical protein
MWRVVEEGGIMAGVAIYDEALWTEASARSMAQRFTEVLSEVAT